MSFCGRYANMLRDGKPTYKFKGFCSLCKPDLLLQIENEHYKDKSRTLNFDPIDTF